MQLILNPWKYVKRFWACSNATWFQNGGKGNITTRNTVSLPLHPSNCYFLSRLSAFELSVFFCNLRRLAHETLSLLYRRVPDALIPVFESCLTRKGVLSRRQYFITGDLAPILGERKYNDPTALEKPESYYLQKINSAETRIRNKVLRNPLVERFIQTKFNVVSNFLLAGCVFQVTTSFFQTLFITDWILLLTRLFLSMRLDNVHYLVYGPSLRLIWKVRQGN